MSLPVSVSNSLESVGYAGFYNVYDTYHNGLSVSCKDISNFSIGVKTNINNNKSVECPIIMANYISHILSNSNAINPNKIKTVVRYLDIRDSYTNHINTSTPLFSSLRYDNHSLKKLILKESVIYYVEKGIILNEDKKPLFLFCATVKKEENADASITNPTIYIAEEVFTTKDIVCKYIKDKVLPFYFTEDYQLGEIWGKIPIKIIVNNNEINKFFVKPNSPTKVNINDDLNKLLLDNIDELFK